MKQEGYVKVGLMFILLFKKLIFFFLLYSSLALPKSLMDLFCILQWQTLISKRTPFQNQPSQMNFLKIIKLAKNIILSLFIIITSEAAPKGKLYTNQ